MNIFADHSQNFKGTTIYFVGTVLLNSTIIHQQIESGLSVFEYFYIFLSVYLSIRFSSFFSLRMHVQVSNIPIMHSLFNAIYARALHVVLTILIAVLKCSS